MGDLQLYADASRVLLARPDNSVVGLTKLDVHNFMLQDHEVANLIGLELAVD